MKKYIPVFLVAVIVIALACIAFWPREDIVQIKERELQSDPNPPEQTVSYEVRYTAFDAQQNPIELAGYLYAPIDSISEDRFAEIEMRASLLIKQRANTLSLALPEGYEKDIQIIIGVIE